MIYMERHAVDENVHRYYSVEVHQDLFGTWVVLRHWGRIGSKWGKRLILGYETKKAAISSLEQILHQKRRRGYVQLPSRLSGEVDRQ